MVHTLSPTHCALEELQLHHLAEIGSGTTKTMASIALDLKDTYFHFTILHQAGKGVVHERRKFRKIFLSF
jgi:hypothetical protein